MSAVRPDESCWHPLPGGNREGPSLSYNAGPDRPAESCLVDYVRARHHGRRRDPGREWAARLIEGCELLGVEAES